jgi:hypothetical protein
VTTKQKWEYKVLSWNSWDWTLLEQTLNDLGDSGWEVVTTMADTIVLKRPSDGPHEEDE